MLIQSSKRLNPFQKILLRIKYNKKILITSFLIIYSGILFLLGIFIHVASLPPDKKDPLAFSFKILSSSRKYNPKISRPETIKINVSQSDFLKLLKKRNECILAGIITTGSKDYVPAKITYKDKVVNADIRLKGDWIEHLEGPKWSYRISIKKDTIMGMKEFSIQHPKTRDFISEWLFHQFAKKEGIIALNFDFVNVIFNDKDLGIYALEQHFDKILIEKNGYIDGPILKFDESILWANRERYFEQYEPNAYYSSPIDVFKGNRTEKKLKNLYEIGFNLLERFRSGELKPDEVFDIEKLARYYALADLLGGQHMAFFHNLRFYLNPITTKLEPIAFDAAAGTSIKQIFGVKALNPESAYYDFDRFVFSDIDFMKFYLRELNKFSEDAYFNGTLKELKPELDKKMNILNKEFSDMPIMEFFMRAIAINKQIIRKTLEPIKAVHAYFDSYDNGILTLRVGNTQGLPIQINGIYNGAFEIFRPIEQEILDGKIESKLVNYRIVRFKSIGDFDWSDSLVKNLKLDMNVLNIPIAQKIDIFPWPKYDENFLKHDFVRQKPNFKEFNFFEVDEKEKKIFIKKGKWNVDKNIIIPEGYKIVAGANTELELINNSKILSYSPFYFIGEEEGPIIIQSSDGTGQGFLVLNAKEKSIFKNVIFENLSYLKENGWELTSPLVFYETELLFSNCQFINNASGDEFVNIIRSKAEIEDSKFSKVSGDALDLDYSTGKLANISFSNCGTDAIDFSGSNFEIENINIFKVYNEGISVGENSTVSAKNINIKSTKVALTSKDNSILTVENLNIQNCYAGFQVYQKKPEFGPSKMIIENLEKKDVNNLFMLEKGSEIVLDGQLIFSREVFRNK